MKDANQNDKIDSARATGGKEPADALALAVNGLYHSHRQGVILCDYPTIAVYDNNGGAQNREAFWSSLKQACSVAPYNIEGEGSYGRADDGTPNTRTLLVRCKYATERREGFVTRDAQIGIAQAIRTRVAHLKEVHGIPDGHDVVLLIPQDRRQDRLEIALQRGSDCDG